MSTPCPTLADKRRDFRALHSSGCFEIPNAYDVVSALALLRNSGVESEVVLDILPSPQLAPFAQEDGKRVIDAEGQRTGHHVAP